MLSSPVLPRRRTKRKPVPNHPFANVRSVKTGLQFVMERRSVKTGLEFLMERRNAMPKKKKKSSRRPRKQLTRAFTARNHRREEFVPTQPSSPVTQPTPDNVAESDMLAKPHSARGSSPESEPTRRSHISLPRRRSESEPTGSSIPTTHTMIVRLPTLNAPLGVNDGYEYWVLLWSSSLSQRLISLCCFIISLAADYSMDVVNVN